MSRYDPKRRGLEYLLDLHRETYEVGGGWWVTIRAVKVAPSEQRPHGLQYSITLHNPKGVRILGYDNAHALPASGHGAKRTKAFDHRHHRGHKNAYEFRSPADLLEDFWRDVEAILKEEGVS